MEALSTEGRVLLTPRDRTMKRLREIIGEAIQSADMVGKVSIDDVLRRKKELRPSAIRWLVFWRLYHREGWKLPKIARVFDMDHSTVLHGINQPSGKIARMLEMPMNGTAERIERDRALFPRRFVKTGFHTRAGQRLIHDLTSALDVIHGGEGLPPRKTVGGYRGRGGPSPFGCPRQRARHAKEHRFKLLRRHYAACMEVIENG